MSEQRTTRQTFLTQVGATLAAVVTLGLFTKGSTPASGATPSADPESLQAVPESRAVPRQTPR